MRTGRLILVGLLAASAGTFGLVCQAQDPTSQTDSLAAAARRAREEKKNQPAKSAAVFTNENLPTTSTISVVGGAASPAATPAATATPPGPAASADDKKAATEAEVIAAAKDKLTNVKKDLDILQRKFNLDQQSYLSNPNHEQDTAGAGALQNEKNQIADKQTEVDAAETEYDELMKKSPASAADATSSDNSSSTDSSGKPAPGTHPF
jgi:hypothetical protein